MKLRKTKQPDKTINVETLDGEIITNEDTVMQWVVDEEEIEFSNDNGKTWEIWMKGKK